MNINWTQFDNGDLVLILLMAAAGVAAAFCFFISIFTNWLDDRAAWKERVANIGWSWK
jgi:hypothetical protein